jgi:hypothetical protein
MPEPLQGGLAGRKEQQRGGRQERERRGREREEEEKERA